MKRTGRKKEWAILVFCMFFLGLSPPIILIFDKTGLVFGFPLSFLYLYGFWAVVIVLIAIGARKRHQIPGPEENITGKKPSQGTQDSLGGGGVR